jgi:hypothetical protein
VGAPIRLGVVLNIYALQTAAADCLGYEVDPENWIGVVAIRVHQNVQWKGFRHGQVPFLPAEVQGHLGAGVAARPETDAQYCREHEIDPDLSLS